jgi:formate dehydrogenase subunit delta
MSPDRLVYMANQIGKFFASQGEDRAVDEIALHLKKYWDPSMRTAIVAKLRDGDAEGLDALPRRAVERLARQADAPGAIPP